MKTLFAILAVTLLSTNAFAKATKVVECESASKDLQISVAESANSSLKAIVRLESTGGSHPKFSYDVRAAKRVSGEVSAQYEGKNFELVITRKFDPSGRYAGTARISDLGVSEKVSCTFWGTLE